MGTYADVRQFDTIEYRASGTTFTGIVVGFKSGHPIAVQTLTIRGAEQHTTRKIQPDRFVRIVHRPTAAELLGA